MAQRIFIMFVVLYGSTASSAFFLNWGGQETQQQYPQYYYHQRLLQAPSYTEQPTSIPSIPIQMPIQAQMSPASSIQNVQLVPCLCPVSQEYEFEKNPKDPSLFYTTNNQQQQLQQHKKN